MLSMLRRRIITRRRRRKTHTHTNNNNNNDNDKGLRTVAQARRPLTRGRLCDLLEGLA